MNIGAAILIFFGVSAICCAIGFKKFVWFLSIGYGFSVAGLGIAYAVFGLITKKADILSLVFSILFIVYGLRLGLFLLFRELKSKGYQKVLKEEIKSDETKMPIFLMVTIWVFCAILYVMQTSSMIFRMYNDTVAKLWFDNLSTANYTNMIPVFIGIVISIVGITFEALADKQKSAQKKENPNMVATKGLYKMVKCPNYLGEILFWTGVFVAGVNAFNGAWQWIIAIIGYICIVYIMFNGAQRLERRQEARYGNDPTYRQYTDHTPIIIPLIPLYHLNKKKDK